MPIEELKSKGPVLAAIKEWDRIAAYPAANPYYPSNLGATIYRLLGVDPRTAIADRLNRPMHLNEGEVIAPLFSGAVG